LYTLVAFLMSPTRTLLLWVACASTALAAETATIPQKQPLWQGDAPQGDGSFAPSEAGFTVHLAGKPNGAAMVVCPGGGYGGLVVGAEGHGIAKWLNDHGIAGIVLEYRLPKGRPFVPLLDAQRALRLVRSHAAEWKIDPKKVGIIGFSAGGHLASTALTHFDAGDSAAADPVAKQGCRPDFGVLVYPVVNMEEQAHRGSRNNLLGANPAPEMVRLFSNEKQVGPQTPPCFLAHALNDKVVTPENSAQFYAALRAHNIPGKYLELPDGGHGLHGYKGPMWDAWQTQSLEWMAGMGLIPKEDAAGAR
jgi:acetyl esterase/lipase